MKLKAFILTKALTALQTFVNTPTYAEKNHISHYYNHYAKIESGIAMPASTIRTDRGNLKARNSLIGGIGVGYKINKFFRTDLMIQRREIPTRTNQVAEVDGLVGSARVNAYTAMLNGYIDGHNNTIFTPYLMAGIGGSHLNTRFKILYIPQNLGGSTRIRRANLFAWNIGLGAQAKIADQVSLDFCYRHINLGKPGRARNLGGNPQATIRFPRELRTHEISAGLIWRF